MPIFETSFQVRAGLAEVAEFHRDTRALRRLTPPPMLAVMGRVEPLAEGSTAEFTLWLGPVPIRWLARHHDVDALHGFTDEQVRGPLQHWRHTHRFSLIEPGITRVNERIEYEHRSGLMGLFTRLMFSPLGLRFLFAYRARVTRRSLESKR